jgi:hypothetical protein
MGPMAISSLKEGMQRIFITLKNPLAGFEPTNLESNGKHAKYYNTKVTHTHTKQQVKLQF